MIRVLTILQKMRISKAGIEGADFLRKKVIEALKAQAGNRLSLLLLTDEIELSEEIYNDDYDEISSEDINNLFRILESTPEVKHLSFNSIVMNELIIREIAEGIKHNRTLDSLDFSNTDIAWFCSLIIIEALKLNNTIKKLDFSRNNKIGCIKNIALLLRDNPNIEYLDISHMDISEEGVRFITEKLRENTTLRYLNISGNNISPLYIRWLATAFLRNKTLAVLDVSDNRFDTRSLIELVRVFIVRPACVKLIIGGAHISMEALNSVSELIRCIRSHLIRAESLEFVNIKPECAQGLAILKKAFEEHAGYMSAIQPKKTIQFSESQLSITESVNASPAKTATVVYAGLVCTTVPQNADALQITPLSADLKGHPPLKLLRATN